SGAQRALPGRTSSYALRSPRDARGSRVGEPAEVDDDAPPPPVKGCASAEASSGITGGNLVRDVHGSLGRGSCRKRIRSSHTASDRATSVGGKNVRSSTVAESGWRAGGYSPSMLVLLP